MPAHATTLVHAGAWIVTFDSLFHCPSRRCVDSIHRRVFRCRRTPPPSSTPGVDSNFRLVVPLSFPTGRRQYPSTRYSVPAHTILVHASAGIVIRLVMPLSSTPAHRQYPSTRRDVYVCYSVLTDAAVSHIEVHTRGAAHHLASVADKMGMPVHVTRVAITQSPRRTHGVPVYTNPSSRPVHGQ